MADPIEFQDSQTPEVEQDTLESLATSEAVEGQEKSELEAKNAKLYARAKKAEEELKTLKAKTKEAAPQPTPKSESPAPTTEPVDEIDVVLRLRTENYTDEEIRNLRSVSKKYKVSIPELMADPIWKAGIEAARAKVKSEEATPSPSGPSILVDNKPVTALSDQEIKTNYSTIVQKAIKEGKRLAREG
jgi:hypothetical protein